MIRSKFKIIPELVFLFGFQLFLFLGAIFKLISEDYNLEYIIVLLFVTSVILLSLFLSNNLFKSLEIGNSEIFIKPIFSSKRKFKFDEIVGFWTYKTIGALGEEETIYFRLKNGKKIGIHSKAYGNYKLIKGQIFKSGLRNLKENNYSLPNLNFLKIVIPLLLFISVILFLITKFL
ncbi:hypothetical protein MMU07_05040 [Aquiflexum sp. LQ15W]|uniref:hypothetical protein n=1 Tax=Cognataquiflexum nitidum TaxID=2922272 RepID=UPI001F12D665|nr:hypothetical protein [Cognataquiflexum nitidum]MCH6198932.1 hypothetical protein [Cognataquiflexum nitidum]